MRSKIISFILLVAALSGQASADGKIRISEQIELNAETETVWQLINDFGDLSWVFGDEAIVEVTGSSPYTGTMRAIQGPAGGTAQEVLIAHNEEERYYSYVAIIADGSPLINYIATLRVFPYLDGHTKVEWSSNFDVREGANAEAV